MGCLFVCVMPSSAWIVCVERGRLCGASGETETSVQRTTHTECVCETLRVMC